MKHLDDRPPSFSSRLWQTLALIVVMAIVFGLYTASERQIDRANDIRMDSFLLVDELRQSSDDLTRLSRTYFVTRDPLYKRQYKEIIAIRDGKRPRPLDRYYSLWNAQNLGGQEASRVVSVVKGRGGLTDHGAEMVPLLELMQRSGLTGAELQKLAEAKANSDALVLTELEAMRIGDAGGGVIESSRPAPMLFNEKYHESKISIMRPIQEALLLIDQRTAIGVSDARSSALGLRNIFIILVLITIFSLWRTYVAMLATLGGSLDEIYDYIMKIGGGDFSRPIEIPPGQRNSVLGHLAETKLHLHNMDMQRRAVEESLRSSEERWKFALEGAGDGLWDWDVVANTVHCSQRCKEILGYADDELGSTFDAWIKHVHPEDLPRVQAAIYAHCDGTTPVYTSEHRLRCKSGEWKWVLDRGMVISRDAAGKPLRMIGTHADIDARKSAEAELRIAATAFQSQEGVMVTDSRGIILRVNQGFVETTGYTPAEVVGQTPRILKSGRHDAAFYEAMWTTIGKTGRWQGEVWDRRKDGEVFPKLLTISAVKDEMGKVTHYVGTHVDISDRKRAEERINLLAFYDTLTGLPNRTLLLERLRRAMTASARSSSHGAVLFIDLDNFKTLNDTLGHDKGDLLLQQVGQRLLASVREDDSVARLGGDEFVIVLENLDTHQDEAANETEVIGEKILSVLNKSYHLGDIEYRSTPSIGATLFRGDQVSIDDLLKQADMAMYKSKSAGRNALRFFDPTMEVVILERVKLEDELSRAIERQQFVLHYQPQIAGDNIVSGAEVLIRWQHPQRGLVPPIEFIPLSEETGQILWLGNWVLETACRQLAMWLRCPEKSHLTLAVNVSPLQFAQADFVDQVIGILERTRADPRRLKLELTESLLVDNPSSIVEKMFALKARGVCFSLDDFGTGYSSLAYLKRMPLDQLKIDQSFVRDVLTDANDAAIAKSIIGLAQSLGLSVIAEGVESAAQRDFLSSHGCYAYQGYFFSRPIPLAEFEMLLQGGSVLQKEERHDSDRLE